ncbi:ATP phosphoribosyltransferase regulatory subunit [Algiphilus sp. W345]|uniref:ATP phosphoribosyltransferase regulatory subunit n=1 Tax=Banduia mediterranea TaxID=3075609 RepID=A0ABU2WLC1_9GAMM|nr:ATP phosphoribosyltransferase regulatory subunit [Algiphilus sp. W345]MDT0498679.1 ATP phosphoribosyltransferase regulatory subunit [Algiphilus sp. W345]
MTRNWMLPDGVEEWLPPSSWALEDLRRKLLDLYRDRGYGLIYTPLFEHLDTLLVGAGSDLESLTFKLVDPASGRLLGLRADMTPQAARIVARRFDQSDVVRLCYIGTVLRTQPDAMGGSRAPRQVGCELFGDASMKADHEILRLLVDTLDITGVDQAHIDLGHVGIYRSLVARLGLNADDEATLFDILQRKSQPDYQAFSSAVGMPADPARLISALMSLNGDLAVIDQARLALADAGDEAMQALSVLESAAAELARAAPQLPLHIDLAELRGYRYQTGLVFAAFVPGHGRELARGGRYDGVGAEFGQGRPATGFSADLNELLRLGA